jgi:toxin ParE1/3/4
MSQYVISKEAIQDLNEISDYFLTHNVEAGERFLKSFQRKCRQLILFPSSGRSYGNIRSDIRGLGLDGFVILYRVSQEQAETSDETNIEILRIVNGRRDLANLFSD